MTAQETIHGSVLDLVGRTPLVRLPKLNETPADLLAKLEFYNPMGSVKDRIGLAMIETAEREGILEHGVEIIEPTSGNTGIALAFVAAAKGYRLTLTMPDSMSQERRAILRALGCELVLREDRFDAVGADRFKEDLAVYDQTMHEYYLKRDSNVKDQTWTAQMAGFMSRIIRPHMKSFLEKKGFSLK